jgi:segregation and condensation protein B
MSSKKTIKSAFESMMFTWGEPLEAKVAAEVFNISRQEAVEYFEELKEEYEQEGRGIVIRRINQSFQFVTREENADYIRALCTPVKTKKLSQSALEVLAIVAYKQPVTKGEIERNKMRQGHGRTDEKRSCLRKRQGGYGGPPHTILYNRYFFKELRLFFHQRSA